MEGSVDRLWSGDMNWCMNGFMTGRRGCLVLGITFIMRGVGGLIITGLDWKVITVIAISFISGY